MSASRTVAYYTLGCKLNFAETSAIGRQLTAQGYGKVAFDQHPDIFLINTCSVTENADKECRTIVNRALVVNPEAVVVVTGCFAQLKPDQIASIPGVDLVLGANEKFNAAAYLDSIPGKGQSQIKSCEIGEVTAFNSSWSEGDRTRVFLKVQDGCDYSCTFCTIPQARGASRSNTIEKVIGDVRTIAGRGAKEIVLTGVNLGDFGIPDPASGERQTTFFDLAKALNELPFEIRYRISSIEPNLLENRTIELVANSSKFVPHFHIPLQSGSDKILRKMRRRYLTGLYSDRVEVIKKLMPDCCIGVDVIVGFPGETEEDFMETYNFLRDLDISYLHVFTYSERDNTLAADMEEVVPMGLRKQRNKMLRILSEKKLRSFYESQIGSQKKVLFEADNKNGWMHGFTDNYVKVRTPYDSSLINQLMECTLTSITDEGDVDVVLQEAIITNPS